MIDAAEQARTLVAGHTVAEIESDRLRRDALLWNFTVLGEAATLVSDETKARFPDIPWRNPARLRNRVVHGYWSVDISELHTTASEQVACETVVRAGDSSVLVDHAAEDSVSADRRVERDNGRRVVVGGRWSRPWCGRTVLYSARERSSSRSRWPR